MGPAGTWPREGHPMKMKGKRPKRKTSVKLAPTSPGHRHLNVIRLDAKPATGHEKKASQAR
jgi:hypothetical protein